MILVDTSVWIDHLRNGKASVPAVPNGADILIHPYVVGELALGSIKRRAAVVEALLELIEAPIATDAEVRVLIDSYVLHGTGIGYIDAHLLASAKLAQAKVWTFDKRLAACAAQVGVAMPTG